MQHQGTGKTLFARLQKHFFLLIFTTLTCHHAQADTQPVVVQQAELAADACFLLGSQECSSAEEQWQQACRAWHTGQAPDKTTHIVITAENPPGLTAFLGQGASVTADYFDCGRDGQPGENSRAWLAIKAQAKKREQWQDLLEKSRAAGTGRWQVAERAGDVTFTLPASRASDTVGASYQLYLQCSARSVVVGIGWADAVALDETQVIERYGSLPPESRVWFIGDEGLAAAHPLPDKAFWQLLSADKYAVRTMPRDAKPHTAFFEPAGLAGAIEPYLAECGMQVEVATSP